MSKHSLLAMRRGPNIKIQKTGAEVSANFKINGPLLILSVGWIEALAILITNKTF